MSLPATPKLDALVNTDTSAVNAASVAIASGAAAAAKLAALKKQLDDVLVLQAEYTTEMNEGTTRLADAQAAAGGLAGSHAGTIAAVTAVASGGLANVAWSGVTTASMTFPGVDTTTGAPGPVTATYPNLLTAKLNADDDLVAKQAIASSRAIDAETGRKQLDVALAALIGFLSGVEADLANAQSYFDSAKLQVSQRNFAGAWWSWHLADALVTRIAAADDSVLMTALNVAVEKYAQAMTDLNAANGEVAAALLKQSRTAFNLNIADGKVRANLAITAP